MRSSCEASATNSRWRTSAPSVSVRASLSAASIDSSVRPSSATSSSASERGIVTDGLRERSTSRAAAVSSVIGSIARRAVARPASSASRAPPSTPKARNTFTRLAVACTSESRLRVLDHDRVDVVDDLDAPRLDAPAVDVDART